jgi:protoporphyrin/coproporphyrin ferrochelatase
MNAVTSTTAYDALLLVSFGGPEGTADVMPFLENVLRGRNVPPERMREVARHYELFGGVSPLNARNRALVAALEAEMKAKEPQLPVYWGNRNWHPLLAETLRQMADEGVRHALAFVTSAYGSYSGCRQYLDDIRRAQEAVGPRAPQVDRLRSFFNHPGFVEANAAGLEATLAQAPATSALVFTAHSIPVAMAETSPYVAQLQETCRLVAQAVNRPEWTLVYQSRSGPPSQPWLGPDIGDHLRALRAKGARDVVVAPIGFVSDHMEVVYDLDTEARALAEGLGLHMLRAPTAGSHPSFIAMVRELVLERTADAPRRFLGAAGPAPDDCPADCCPPPPRGGPPR